MCDKNVSKVAESVKKERLAPVKVIKPETTPLPFDMDDLPTFEKCGFC